MQCHHDGSADSQALGVDAMNVLQLLGCMRGKHLRSRRRAQSDGHYFRSRCVGCGRPMIRIYGGWRLDNQPKSERVGTSKGVS